MYPKEVYSSERKRNSNELSTKQGFKRSSNHNELYASRYKTQNHNESFENVQSECKEEYQFNSFVSSKTKLSALENCYDYEKCLETAEASTSFPNMAANLMCQLFDATELTQEYTVTGRSPNGSTEKKPLDPKRIDFIKSFVLDKLPKVLIKPKHGLSV